PTPKAQENLDSHDLIDDALLALDPHTFLTTVLNNTLSPSDLADVVEHLGRKDWQWDVDAAATFARCNDQVHPESVFSVARRFHMLEVVEKNSARENFAFIETLKDGEFAQAAALMVR